MEYKIRCESVKECKEVGGGKEGLPGGGGGGGLRGGGGG